MTQITSRRSVTSEQPRNPTGRFTSETGRQCGSLTSISKASAARRNGLRGGRPRKVGPAHQYVVRERLARLEPREPLANLDGSTVERIDTATARLLILRYEWLGTLGRPRACYGLYSREGDLMGAVTFGNPAGNGARQLCGPEWRDQVIALERGACVHWAPRNAATFLLRRAVRLAHRDFGWSIFLAYADPSAGEIGTIYQASNWFYIGTGRQGRARDRFMRPDGRVVDERMLRHGGLRLADVVGWRRVSAPAKHRYVWFEGAEAATLRQACRARTRAYPKR